MKAMTTYKTTYEADDGPLTAGDIARLRKVAQPDLPKGKVLIKRSL